MRLLTGRPKARQIWGEHIREVGAPHSFEGCPTCQMALALGLVPFQSGRRPRAEGDPWRGIGTVWLRQEGDSWRAWWTRYNENSEPYDEYQGTRQEAADWARSIPARQRVVFFPPDTWVDLESDYEG